MEFSYKDITYGEYWLSASKEQKIQMVLESHAYMMKHFGKHRRIIISLKTADILKRIKEVPS